MPNDAQINLRLPSDLLARLKKLEGRVSKDPSLTPYRVSLQSVMRMALLRGLNALELEHTARRSEG